MRKYILFIALLLSTTLSAFAQRYTIKGKVTGGKAGNPVEFATVFAIDNGIWAVTNAQGEFTLANLPGGKCRIQVNSLGYVERTEVVDVPSRQPLLVIALQEDNLALDEVVVTAKRKTNDIATSYAIDRTTLDHTQILNINDITSLLPGGKSNGKLNLADADDRLAIRASNSSEFGNPSFGTAVEVDGMRVQNNASFDETKGGSTRNIGTTNIESIEVVTGVPSVEHGDFTSGLVKINTRKGVTPVVVDLSTMPHTKQAAISKGFLLGSGAGTLNASLEYTKSTADLASPHTTYDRNAFSLTYDNTFNKKGGTPLRLTAGLSGNAGGYDSKADPDAFQETYTKKRDNAFQGYAKLNWLLNKPWITNVEASASMSYADKLSEINVNKSASSTTAFIHATEEGYYMAAPYDKNNPDAPIILSPVGYWYELAYRDSKPVSYTAKFKADWTRQFGTATNTLMAGGQYDRSGNEGRGLYYSSMEYAPTWREDRHDSKPYMNNIAWYAENKITLPVAGQSKLQVMAGIRSDITGIRGSEYGTVQSFSPRFNARFTLWEKADTPVRDFSLQAGWGKAVKLPSFEVLYPTVSYADDRVFAAGTTDGGTTYDAYHSRPNALVYNRQLKWQYARQTEVGFSVNIKGVKVSVTASRSKTSNPYMAVNTYVPYTYNYTLPEALNGLPIPSADRIYTIDRQTGTVTVADRTGANPSQQLVSTARNDYKANRYFTNGSPVERNSIEWSIAFPQIPALRTSVMLNGNFYQYRGVEESLIAWKPGSSISTSDGNPYQYVGYYVGTSNTSTSASSISGPSSPNTSSATVANGRLTKEANTNLRFQTHIPKIRLVVSLTVEASLYNYSRNLSEYGGSSHGYVLEDVNSLTGSGTNIYGGDRYVAVYPLYYSTWSEPDVKKDFEKDFLWAKDNDPALYSDLSKLVTKTNTSYYFNPNRVSAYFSANINVTKEIGKYASLSFYANNFLNNMALVKSSQSNTESTLYNSSYIPRFTYGLSLKLKL